MMKYLVVLSLWEKNKFDTSKQWFTVSEHPDAAESGF